ncbi:hypothetical protein DsansV1_C34g0224851 [Dioscorea sansibarensis]
MPCLRRSTCGDECEVPCVGPGASPTLSPIHKFPCIIRVLGDPQGVNKRIGECGLLETVSPTLAVKAGEDETNGTEVFPASVDHVQERPEPLPLFRSRSVPEHRLEHAAQQPKPNRLFRHHRRHHLLLRRSLCGAFEVRREA